MRNISVIVLVASVAFMAGAGVTYVSREVSWISDMSNQPSIKPQERPFRPPERSVPTNVMEGAIRESAGNLPAEAGHREEMSHEQGPGSGEASGHEHDSSEAHGHGSKETPKSGMKPRSRDDGGSMTSSQPHDHSSHSHGPAQKSKKAQEKHPHNSPTSAPHAHDDGKGEGHADGGHTNMPTPVITSKPVKATPGSTREGQRLFNIYCAVCHGNEGQGGMPMEKALPDIPKFTPQLLRRESDPHMFSMVTSGHGPMPGYAEALKLEERWHVVNYLRTLQNKPTDGEGQNSSKGKGS